MLLIFTLAAVAPHEMAAMLHTAFQVRASPSPSSCFAPPHFATICLSTPSSTGQSQQLQGLSVEQLSTYGFTKASTMLAMCMLINRCKGCWSVAMVPFTTQANTGLIPHAMLYP